MKLTDAWDSLWFRPESPSLVRTFRAILSAHALWVLLSRPDIPDVVRWPAPFFAGISHAELARFGVGIVPASMEWPLFALLHLMLVFAGTGIFSRVACAASGLLLYHFAPFEELIAGTPHTFFGGLTVPCLGLLILAFARQPRKAEDPSWEFGWPVTLIRLLMSLNYFCAFLAKLRFSGPLWFTATNISRWTIINMRFGEAPLAQTVASHSTISWAIAIGTLLVEALSPLAAFSRRARLLFLPAAVLGHIGIALTMNIWFPSLPLLLLFVDWPVRKPGRRAITAVGVRGEAAASSPQSSNVAT